MKVSELIERLRVMPDQDALVVTWSDTADFAECEEVFAEKEIKQPESEGLYDEALAEGPAISVVCIR